MSLLCTTLSLVLGLYFLRNNIIISIVISLAYLFFILIRFNRKIFIISILLFATGAIFANLNIKYTSSNNVYSGFVIESKSNYFIFESHFEKYYVYEEKNDREVGDYLIIDGNPCELSFLTFESQFNFADYLNNKGVKRELKTNIIDIKYRSFIRTKNFKNNFLSKFDENTRPLVDAFLFNEKDYSNSTINIVNEFGLAHLLSLSGVYLHLIFAVLTYFLSIKFSKKASEIIPFILLLPYSIFSLNKIGTLRVYSLYLLKIFNNYKLKGKFQHIELVSILALIFIIFDYNLVYQEAFYIGFLLSLLAPFLNNSLAFISKKKKRYCYPFIIFLLLFPLSINNESFPLFKFLFNIILIIPNLIFLSLCLTNVVIPINGLTNWFGGVLTKIIKILGKININVPISTLGGTFVILFYVFIIIGIYFLESIRIKHFKIISCLILSLITFAIVPLQESLTNAVYFINVGQGDSILIKNRKNVVMIDTGGYKNNDLAKNTLIPFLIKKRIYHIDYLILTHDDFDHTGAASSLVENFRVKNVIDSKNYFPLIIGEIKLENLNEYESSDDNDSSLVIYTNFMNKKWLLMGDASSDVENYLINKNDKLRCDILKVGHHGSKSSTSNEFLDCVKPSTAIISVGAKNYYKHPNKEVIDRLISHNIKIRRTDYEGTISYISLFS